MRSPVATHFTLFFGCDTVVKKNSDVKAGFPDFQRSMNAMNPRREGRPQDDIDVAHQASEDRRDYDQPLAEMDPGKPIKKVPCRRNRTIRARLFGHKKRRQRGRSPKNLTMPVRGNHSHRPGNVALG